jgi:hypothetical protein
MKSKMNIRSKIRSCRLGSNKCSDKYQKFVAVEDTFKDLALFIAETQFHRIMVKQPTTDDIFKVFNNVYELLASVAVADRPRETCSVLEFKSLDIAWALMQFHQGDDLFYVVDKQCFVLYISNNDLNSVKTEILLSEEEPKEQCVLFSNSFQHQKMIVSIDDFILKNIEAFIIENELQNMEKSSKLLRLRSMRVSQGVYLALKIMIPSHIFTHKLSRHSIVNRIYKRQDIICK